MGVSLMLSDSGVVWVSHGVRLRFCIWDSVIQCLRVDYH